MSGKVPVERHYSVRSAALILDRSGDFVLDLIKKGVFSRVLDLGASRSAYRIPESELQAYIDANTIELKKPAGGAAGQNINI